MSYNIIHLIIFPVDEQISLLHRESDSTAKTRAGEQYWNDNADVNPPQQVRGCLMWNR